MNTRKYSVGVFITIPMHGLPIPCQNGYKMNVFHNSISKCTLCHELGMHGYPVKYPLSQKVVTFFSTISVSGQ